MIKSFKDKGAKAIFEGHHPGKGFPADLIRPARRKLVMLADAKALKDLRNPPSNHLEALKKERAGRICFVWTGSDAENVEIAHYH